jgi:hypothetical protein
VVQVAQQPVVLIGRNLQFQLFSFAPDSEVALNAALRIQHQVPCAGIGSKVVDRVGHHAAQPAKAIFAAHGHALEPPKVVNRGSKGQRRRFRGGRVQLTWCERASISNEFRRRHR